MKKILVTFLLSLITLMMSVSALAKDVLLIAPNPYATMPITEGEEEILATVDNTIKVQLNGSNVDFTDAEGNVVNPKIINNRTMVPMRKIFEIFDANVNWDNETRTVVATTETKEITLTINSDKAKLKDLVANEEKEITLDSAPVLVDNRTMVPVRFIAESLEKEVGWDADEKTVIIIDFDKVEKDFEEKVPMLKELFAIETEPVESFKTESEIEGKIVYKDPEDKTKNETITIEGELELNMNKAKEFEMHFDLEFEGKGTIYESLKESGMEKFKASLIMADDGAYVMVLQDGKEVWANMGDEVDLSALTSMQIANNPKSYAEYIDVLKTTMGELDTTSYMTIETYIAMLANIYSEENLQITGTSSKKTLKLNINVMEFIEEIIYEIMKSTATDSADLSSIKEGIDGIKLELNVVETLSKGKVEDAKVALVMAITEPETKESIEIEFVLDMEFESVNKDFDIKLPKVEVIQ